MSSQNLQETVLDSQTLKQLQSDIQKELLEVLNNSQLSKVLQKYGISQSEVLKISYQLDLNKLQNIVTDQNQLSKDCLLTTEQQQIEASAVLLKPCPIEGYPDGCWVDS
ncbi:MULTISPECIES: hypothetical protein [unclassified Anabaena]|uniref:hypothetical protein n=1 Tax=unclassified Anabaena TaxID=2619674 RepID=UPI000835D46E|nr:MULTISPECIES: hypothetical protein [unclassified Anabaena]